MNVPIAANVLGTIGAICWSVQLIPQIVLNHRRHSTEGLQSSMMLLWASAGVPLGVYNITENFNIALRIQAQILTCLSLITWAQCMYYGKGWSKTKSALVLGAMGSIMGGIEAGLITALRKANSEHIGWPSTFMAVLAALLLALGVLRHYLDIYKHRTVRGISFMFVGIDAAGDFFSLISIFFQPRLDPVGMAIYATELVLWIGVMAAGGWYNFRPWIQSKISRRRQRRQAEAEESEAREARAGSSSVTMHQMPSSTSVFRTPSNLLIVRTHTESGIED